MIGKTIWGQKKSHNGYKPKWLRRITTPGIKDGVLIRSGWAGTTRFPETRTSRARQQELFGGMDQVEFLSVLHTVGNLLRKWLTNVSLWTGKHQSLRSHQSCASNRSTISHWKIVSSVRSVVSRKTQTAISTRIVAFCYKQELTPFIATVIWKIAQKNPINLQKCVNRKTEMKEWHKSFIAKFTSSGAVFHLSGCYITFESEVIVISSSAVVILRSNFLLTEQKSKCEKKELIERNTFVGHNR